MINIKIFLGVDHQGLKYKDELVKYLISNGIDVVDTGLSNDPLDDYPDYAFKVCENVVNNDGLGVLICGSGIGMSIAANKVKGIRCARVVNENDAFTAKNHNGANVIAFGSNIDIEEAKKIIDTFIVTKKPTEERHLRRIDKIINKECSSYNEL